MPARGGSRFSYLQKRLERRNNSLKPIYNNSEPTGNPSEHSSRSKKERRTLSEQALPELIESIDTPPSNPDSREGGKDNERDTPPEVTSEDPFLERKGQINPTMIGYLPVAMPRSDPQRHEGHFCVAAEEEYLALFNAPSHIELQQRATFDDCVTDVSEITTDVRGLSTMGATYAASRFAGKLQRQLENHGSAHRGHHPTSGRAEPPGEHHGMSSGSGGAGVSKGHSYVEVDFTDLRHLNRTVERAKTDFIRAITPTEVVPRHGLPYEATDFRGEGDDEESEDIWDDAIQGSHLLFGLASVQANQRPSGQLDPEDGDVLCVQGPPTPKEGHSPKVKTNSNPLQNLVVETLSDEGDVVIDTTEIRDEDLDGVSVLDRSRRTIDDRTVGTSVLFGENLLAEEIQSVEEKPIVQCEAPKQSRKASKKSPKTTDPIRVKSSKSRDEDIKKSAKTNIATNSTQAGSKVRGPVSRVKSLRPQDDDINKSAENKRIGASNEPGTKLNAPPVVSSPRAEPQEVKTTPGFSGASSYPPYEEQYVQPQNDSRDDHNSVFVQKDQKNDSLSHDATRIASDFYNSSLRYYKSFVRHVDGQLKSIQQQGLIDDSDMDGMLTVLERGMVETSNNLPAQSDEAIIFLGEEFERSTCGIDRSTGDHGRDLGFPSETVDKMLDSLKKIYKKGLTTCGVDRAVIADNTRAIEDMVADLKQSYHENSSACGKSEDVLGSCGKKGDMFAAADRIVWGSHATARHPAVLLHDESGSNSIVASDDTSNRPRRDSKTFDQGPISHSDGKCPRDGELEPTELKEKSMEAVEAMLSCVGESYSKKLSKIKTRRRRTAQSLEPQTFLIPINMPAKDAPSSAGYSAIE
jgi:hypothetical protein